MDNELFDKEDVLTNITAEQAVLGTKGFFGDTLHELIDAVKQRDVRTLSEVDNSCHYPFGNDREINTYNLFFLPLDKVMEPVYRPFKSLDELLEFLVPDLDVNDVCGQAGNKVEIDKYKKAELLLGMKIILREKQGAYTNVVIIQSVDFYGDSDAGEDIHINNNPLNFMFEAYKILIDGKWVPFGVKSK